MLHKFQSLFFPMCSCGISILIIFMYFYKDKDKNKNNKLYSKMLILSFVGSILDLILTLLIYILKIKYINCFIFIKKILYILYIIWFSLLFVFFLSYFNKNDNVLVNNLKISSLIINLILFLLILILPLNIVFDSERLLFYFSGMSSFIFIIGLFIYLFLMIVIEIINHKINNHKNHFLLFMFFLLLLFLMIVRMIDPYIDIIPYIIIFISSFMYFMIENSNIQIFKKLEFAQAQVAESNKVKSDFLRSMSHEIRTPLNAIVGFGELIDKSNDSNEIKEYSKDLLDASNTLLLMLTNVINILKIDVDDDEIIEIEYDLGKEIDDILNMFRYKISCKNLKFNKNINVPTNLIGDKDKVKRIITNLIDNAIKYCDNGLINLTVASKVKTKTCNLRIIVEDTGKGIDNDTIAYIFDDFVRSSEDINSDKLGMGLGLTITKKLVELLDGNIDCISRKGKGTKFIVNIVQKIGDKNK